MSKSFSIISALVATFIWGTAFIAQDIGMDNVGPLTFNASRFLIAFISVLPFALFFESKKIIKEIKFNKKNFIQLLAILSGSLFLGTYIQTMALKYTIIANAAFFTGFYVIFVPILLYFIHSKKVHWSIWPSIGIYFVGAYLLSNISKSEIMLGDGLIILSSFFWALHIIFVGKFMETFDIPIFFAVMQALVVGILSIFFAYLFEDINFSKILLISSSIIYVGVFSGGIAFTLQMFAQRNIEEAPASIIYSLEAVFASVAAWIILNQILLIHDIIGCALILLAILFSQLAPIIKK